MSRHIVLTTFGSLGDLHPCLAIGRSLVGRGHRVTLATSARYRDFVLAAGLGFHAVSPDIADYEHDPDLIAYLLDERRGPERLVREIVMPHVRAAYSGLLEVSADADVLVTHALTYAGRLVAEKRKLPWVSAALQPMVFFSRYDPPRLAPAPWLARLRFLGPSFHGALNGLMHLMTRGWAAPWHALRDEIGLPKTSDNPVLKGQFSPYGTLALFSRLMAEPQPDWPPQTVITGFPMYDATDDTAATGIRDFLAAGPPPIVFTRGSAVVHDAGDFFRVSVAAADRLGQRALLTVGNVERNRIPELPGNMLAVPYAPFSMVFPAASVIVHQCGAGTCGQALAAGKPMLLVPHAFDQPDNAARLERLGVGRTIGRGRYTVEAVTGALARLIDDRNTLARAREAGEEVRATDGADRAAEVILKIADGG